ncbi:MAG TPA: DUF4266 domain-containing protein [Caulobacteraceae bacterium]|nr:DUF4266 domain-containing protein [Caulobacteraceae bacterium]
MNIDAADGSTIDSGRVVLIICLLAALLGACAHPWDRDLLAKRAMQLNTHPAITAAQEHVYFSKEGSSGGRTFDGGGCGCN